jgi:hypothetical protein
MTVLMTKIIDGEGNETIREMNAEEIAQYEADMIEVAARAAEREAKETARVSRREKLLALGLTEEELDA